MTTLESQPVPEFLAASAELTARQLFADFIETRSTYFAVVFDLCNDDLQDSFSALAHDDFITSLQIDICQITDKWSIIALYAEQNVTLHARYTLGTEKIPAFVDYTAQRWEDGIPDFASSMCSRQLS